MHHQAGGGGAVSTQAHHFRQSWAWLALFSSSALLELTPKSADWSWDPVLVARGTELPDSFEPRCLPLKSEDNGGGQTTKRAFIRNPCHSSWYRRDAQRCSVNVDFSPSHQYFSMPDTFTERPYLYGKFQLTLVNQSLKALPTYPVQLLSMIP